jgi:B12-binding domain/radical SAM domain protein
VLDLAVLLVGNRRNWNSVGALAGALEVDPRFQDLPLSFTRPGAETLRRLRDLLGRYRRVVAGFSFMTPDIMRIATEVAELRRALPRQALPGLSLVAGGPHATAAWRSTLALGFDYAVAGEGEVAFPELLWQIATEGKPEEVRGVAYVGAGGAFVWNGRARPVCLDRYPPFSGRYRHQGPIEISRGCLHRCRFCATPFLAGRRLRHRKLAHVLRYVESCLAEGLDQIRFVAPDSLAYGSADGKPRLDVLQELLRATSELAGRENTYLGSFPSEVRPESVSPQAVGLIARYCGNDNLVIGAQSGSQRLLDLMRRGHSVADVYRAVEITLAAGLQANVDIIFGLPGETGLDRDLTLKLIEDLAGRGARIHSHTFMPLPGTPWAACPPGTVDEETARRLGGLASQGLQYGSWRKQAQQAREMVEFMAGLERRAQGSERPRRRS